MTPSSHPDLGEMPENWNVVELGLVSDITKLAGYEFTKHFKYIEEGEIIALRSLNVVDGQLDTTNVKRIAKSVSEALPRSQLFRNDILLTYTGSKLGDTALVDSDDKYHLAPNVCRLRANDDDDAYFLYVFLRSKAFAALLDGYKVGSGQPTVPMKNIRKIPLPWPPKQERDEIGQAFRSLNDKIEINRQTNQTLEEMAQAVFKSWFVDFDPTRAKIKARDNGQDPNLAAMAAIAGKPLDQLDTLSPEQITSLTATADLFPDKLVPSEPGEIPEGWCWSEIGNEVTVAGGGTPSTKNEAFWEGGHIHWTSPKDMSNLTDKILLETARKITQAGLDKISSGVLPKNTVLMSSRAPVGYLAISKIPVAINQGYIAMKCEGVLTSEFVVQWAESIMDDIKQRASGTTFAEISKKNFKVIPVIVPDAELVGEYSTIVGSLYDKITGNLREKKSLTEVRDTLLPKLISGEIILSEAV
ncbi:restriction endonuclease subunit S [Pseudophaeobacter sp.]|uniref:restriction endonuclease subunit S n=1 Tax=Pseudophaeobacter sp. TaxID=1971739 RepID=UPI003296BAA4